MNNKIDNSQKFLKYIIVILLGLFIIQGILVGIQSLWVPDKEEVNQPAYRVAESQTQVHHLWTQENLFSFYVSKGGLLLDGTDEGVYFLGKFEDDDLYGLSLIKFDLHSGEIVWHTIDNRPAPFGDQLVSGLATNANSIFVSFLGTQSISGETLIGAAKLRAYDIHGNPFWLRAIGGARSITTIIATNTTVSINGNFSSNYYILDANSGGILNTIPKEDGDFIWLIEEDIQYGQKEFVIQAVETSSEKTIWQNMINEPIFMAPVISDDHIVLRTNEVRFLGTGLSVNEASGQIIWEYSNILSNIAVDDSVAYFLTEDMQLVGKDIRNGQVLFNINFEPNEAVSPENNVYQIAANNNIVVIYFGGANQLSAFRISEN